MHAVGCVPVLEETMSLGENIYKHRSARNWSQTDLAEALEVSRQSISKWENNMATPDLDKVIRMGQIFGVTLDELVFDKPAAVPEQPVQLTERHIPSFRVMMGVIILVFGMIFFLLSIFWGDHLYFGEVFGELVSAVTVLISIALIKPYDLRVLAVCSIIYLIYMIVCFGVLHISSVINSLFTLVASFVILIWFIVCGLHANAADKK
jgi:transcriptional regulator with XRE-family HTH domain